MRSAILLLLAVLAPAAHSAAPPPQHGPAISRALAFLRKSQSDDGHFKPTRPTARVPVTALAALAFLSAGHVPGKGPDGVTLDKALSALLNSQQPNGWLSDARSGHAMYGHAMATLALSRALAADPKRADIAKALDKAIAFSFSAQRKAGPHKGGWRYQPTGGDGDMSITGWMALSLCAARDAGRAVDPDKLALAAAFARSCINKHTGAFAYTRGGGTTQACTAAGILILALISRDRLDDADLPKAEAWLARDKPSMRYRFPMDATYLGCVAMGLRGGPASSAYRDAVADFLLSRQLPNGSWPASTQEGSASGGPGCPTALAVLALTAHHHLPAARKPAK